MLTLSRRIYFMLENVSACLTVWVNEAHNQKYTELVFIVPSTFSHSICNGENCKDLESRRNVKIYFHLSPHSVLTLHAVFSRSLNVFSSSYLSLSRVVTLFFTSWLSYVALVTESKSSQQGCWHGLLNI